MTSRQSLRSTRGSRASLNPLQASAAVLSENMANLNLNGARLSEGKPSLGRPSLARQSTSGPSLTHAAKDPRPIKDKKLVRRSLIARWQQNAIARLIQFLIQSGFPHPISAKTLATPSSKDFQLIFKFLYAQLDPHYQFEKKFEEEVPVLIKSLRYPFADQINKSNLFTVGSLHAWPTLLAMLLWIVDVVLVDQLDQFLDEGQEHLSELELADKMYFEYISHAYGLWLENNEDEVINKHLLGKFGTPPLTDCVEKKDEKVKKDVEKLMGDYSILEKEWQALSQSEAPLTVLEREKSILESDKEKFKAYIAHVEGKKQKLQEICKSLQEEFESSEISPADVDRMNAERDQLAKTLSLMTHQLDEVTKAVWNEEIALQKKMDALERSADKFNALLYKLDLLGSTDVRFACVSKELELYVQQSRPESMVSVSLKQKVKPALQLYTQSFKDQLFKINDDTIALQEKMDILAFNVSKKEEEVQQIVSAIKSLNERYLQEKDQIGQVLTGSNQELEEMERQIQQLKLQANSITTNCQQEIKKTTIE
ncbi:kinetochore-associated Ndc80 complex subunit ndc80 [Kappamyces sp. JEL0680]|nr:kinetochore-associated Ndc80 complex subunit ndc80 [Kappamyces sp. JEL0680]